jgi:protein TonB
MNIKKSTLSILLLALTMGAVAQNADSTPTGNNTEKKVSENRVLPQFPGGKEALAEYLQKKLRYPQSADAYGVEGRVVIKFTVKEDGSLSDIEAHDCKIERFNTTKFSQETESRQKALRQEFALQFAKEGARVVRKMPKWIPGTIDGKAVSTIMHLPIRFFEPNK